MNVTDDRVRAALAFLQDGADDYAKARAAHEWSEKNEKVVLAVCIADSSEKTVAAKDAQARQDPRYADAIAQTRACAELAYKLRAKRDAAGAIIEAWRTEQSNERAHARTSNVRRTAA